MKGINISLFLTLILIVFTSCKNEKSSNSKIANIKMSVACNLPLTGDLAYYGEPVQKGILLAQKDLENNTDSIKIVFDFQDNKSLNKDAVSILNLQLTQKPDLYVSGLDHQTSVILDKLMQSKIPHITWSWEPFICSKDKTIFRTGINLEQESKYYVEFIAKVKPSKVAIIHINDPGSYVQFDSLVIPEIKSLGITNIYYEAFDFEQSSFKSLASKVKAYKPDAIIIAGYDIHLVNLVKEFKEFGVTKNGNTMCSVDLLDAAPKMDMSIIEGLFTTAPKFVFNSDKNILDWKSKYKVYYGSEPKYSDAYAYDMTMILYDVAKRLKGKSINSESIIESLLSTNIEGITGKLTFSKVGDLDLNLRLCQFNSGNVVPVN